MSLGESLGDVGGGLVVLSRRSVGTERSRQKDQSEEKALAHAHTRWYQMGREREREIEISRPLN